MKLYTKTGDDGSTGLMYSRRVGKDHIAVEVLCGIDDIVAHCGLVRTQLDDLELNNELIWIQERCFRMGTFFATDPDDRSKLIGVHINVTEKDVETLEIGIDRLSETFAMPTQFVHPGDNLLSASCDLARVSVRRCEISAVQSISSDWVEPNHIVFVWLNRLSDYFYALARSCEHNQILREKQSKD